MKHTRWLALTAAILSAAAIGGCASGESGHEGHTDNKSQSEGVSTDSKEDTEVK